MNRNFPCPNKYLKGFKSRKYPSLEGSFKPKFDRNSVAESTLFGETLFKEPPRTVFFELLSVWWTGFSRRLNRTLTVDNVGQGVYDFFALSELLDRKYISRQDVPKSDKVVHGTVVFVSMESEYLEFAFIEENTGYSFICKNADRSFCYNMGYKGYNNYVIIGVGSEVSFRTKNSVFFLKDVVYEPFYGRVRKFRINSCGNKFRGIDANDMHGFTCGVAALRLPYYYIPNYSDQMGVSQCRFVDGIMSRVHNNDVMLARISVGVGKFIIVDVRIQKDGTRKFIDVGGDDVEVEDERI